MKTLARIIVVTVVVAQAAATTVWAEPGMSEAMRTAADMIASAREVGAVARSKAVADAALWERFKDLEEGVVEISHGAGIVGSGFVIENGPDGIFVLTNNHVAGRKDTVGVTFRSHGLAPHVGEVIGTSQASDVALVRVDPAQLGQQAKLVKVPALKLGDSDTLKFRDEVVAIGHPMRAPYVLTFGHATHDAAIFDGNAPPLIRYDGHISPGNSGGPLFNLAGEVIGINTAILPPPAQGVCFAVAINLVRYAVLPELRRGKGPAKDRMRYGSMGVLLQPLTPELMLFLGLDTYDGAIVAQVREGGPGFAEGSGLKLGDVIVGVDGHRGENAGGIQFRTAFSPWDFGDPKGLGNALFYEVIPERRVRDGKASDPGSRWRMYFSPERQTISELQKSDAAPSSSPDADSFSGVEGEYFGMHALDTTNGLWIRFARVPDKDKKDMEGVYLRAIAVKNADGTLAFHQLDNVLDLSLLWRQASERNPKEVLAVISNEKNSTPYSHVKYVLVPLAQK